MTTAALSTRPFAAARAGRPADSDGFGSVDRFGIDPGDVRAVALAFATAASLALCGALACDVYLAAIIGRGALADFAAYQLARDLLPWCCAFTAITALLAGLGLKTAVRSRADRV